MESWQLSHIDKNLPKLIEVTDCSHKYLSYLKSDGVLSNSDVEQLETKRNNSGKTAQAHLMYAIVKTRGNGYEKLVKALQNTNQSGALEIILGFCSQGLSYPLDLILNNLELPSEDIPTEWENLDGYLQSAILQRSISFQGHITTLSNLFQDYSVNNVDELMSEIKKDELISLWKSSDEFAVGTDTVPEKLSYYVPRTLSFRSRLNPDVFKVHSENDKFIIKGMSRAKLSSLAHPQATEVSGRQLDNVTVRFIWLEFDQDFDILSSSDMIKNPEHSYHLLHYQHGDFIWQQSHGDMSLIQKYIDTEQSQVSEVDFVSSLTDNNRRAFCSSDAPGMGKTVLLAEMARLAKQQDPRRLVFFFSLQNFVSSFVFDNGVSEKTCKTTDIQVIIEQLKTLIAKKGSCSDLGYRILLQLLNSQKVPIYIFLDGYDEVRLDQFKIAQTLLKILATNFINVKLFVSTRPHLLHELENILEVLGHNIVSFQKEDQVNFLVDYWQHSIANNYDRQKARVFAVKCLHILQSNMTDGEKDIAGIPLQCMLLADIYQDQLIRYQLSRLRP